METCLYIDTLFQVFLPVVKRNKEIYEIEQNFAQPLQIVLRQNTGFGYVETLGTSEKRQTIVVTRPKRQAAPRPLIYAERLDGRAWGNGFDDVETDKLQPVDISSQFNSQVSDIFKNFYLSPRSPYTTLQIPVHGIGEWCHPEMMAKIDDTALREKRDERSAHRRDRRGHTFPLSQDGP